MHLLPRFSLIATLTKHDIAGIIIAVVAVALIVTGGAKLATKAVKGVLVLMVLGVLAAVVAVLLLTRAI
jgi:drug/metabolite transporter (DMT)-like permease